MEIINKKLNYIPNLSNYDAVFNGFNWNDHISDLQNLPNGKFNAGYCIARYDFDSKKNKIAIYWENDKGEKRKITFGDLDNLSNKFANYLKDLNIKKGDRAFIFLAKKIEIYYCFLGLLKIGAIAGNFFPAFGHQALIDRINNSKAKLIVTSKDLLPRIEEIKSQLPSLEKIILIEELDNILSNYSSDFLYEEMQFDDPLLMMFTSATGNTPISGIVLPQKSILQHLYTAKWVLDLKTDDIYWCTADPGWITGTVYGIIAPLMLGITQIVYEGRFDIDKWYSIIEKYKISVLYTSPTAIRMCQKKENIIEKYNFKSLRHILSVGEALFSSSIEWAIQKIGIPIHDTYWQTETGGIMISNLPVLPIKPGSMGKPMPGIEAMILDDNLNILNNGKEGDLVFRKGWPAMLVNVWDNKKSYDRYFKENLFFTGDRAYKDKDGYFWFVGRDNDVIKTSGERIGPFEVESVISKHPLVVESAVIGKPDDLRGQIIKAFIVLKDKNKASDDLKEEIKQFVKKELAGHAYPKEIEFVDKIPKNKSGKIVRRILKAKEEGLPVGDISTLEEEYLK